MIWPGIWPLQGSCPSGRLGGSRASSSPSTAARTRSSTATPARGASAVDAGDAIVARRGAGRGGGAMDERETRPPGASTAGVYSPVVKPPRAIGRARAGGEPRATNAEPPCESSAAPALACARAVVESFLQKLCSIWVRFSAHRCNFSSLDAHIASRVRIYSAPPSRRISSSWGLAVCCSVSSSPKSIVVATSVELW